MTETRVCRTCAADILSGDQTGGGHLWPGLAGKTPFPQGWSASKVMQAISDVATNPESTWTVQGSRAAILGNYEGVDIRVILDLQDDEIITGYPTNLPRNP
jgi:filamentous hemagglutinin